MTRFAAHRQVGQATVWAVSGGHGRWDPGFPAARDEWQRRALDVDESGRAVFGLNCVVIRLAEVLVVVDPIRWRPEERAAEWESLRMSPGLEAAMSEAGLEAELVTDVVLSHAHPDHFPELIRRDNGQLTFPHARHYLGRADWEANDGSRNSLGQLGPIADAGLLELIEGPMPLAPGLELLPSPGETAGHHHLRLGSGDQAFYYLADLFHHNLEIEHPEWVPNPRTQNIAALLSSRQEFFEEAANSNALMVMSHEPFEPFGTIVRSGSGCLWVRETPPEV